MWSLISHLLILSASKNTCMSESQNQYIMKIGFQSIVNTLVVSPSLDEAMDLSVLSVNWSLSDWSVSNSVSWSVCLSTYQTVSEFVRY